MIGITIIIDSVVSEHNIKHKEINTLEFNTMANEFWFVLFDAYDYRFSIICNFYKQ